MLSSLFWLHEYYTAFFFFAYFQNPLLSIWYIRMPFGTHNIFLSASQLDGFAYLCVYNLSRWTVFFCPSLIQYKSPRKVFSFKDLTRISTPAAHIPTGPMCFVHQMSGAKLRPPPGNFWQNQQGCSETPPSAPSALTTNKQERKQNL